MSCTCELCFSDKVCSVFDRSNGVREVDRVSF